MTPLADHCQADDSGGLVPICQVWRGGQPGPRDLEREREREREREIERCTETVKDSASERERECVCACVCDIEPESERARKSQRRRDRASERERETPKSPRRRDPQKSEGDPPKPEHLHEEVGEMARLDALGRGQPEASAARVQLFGQRTPHGALWTSTVTAK